MTSRLITASLCPSRSSKVSTDSAPWIWSLLLPEPEDDNWSPDRSAEYKEHRFFSASFISYESRYLYSQYVVVVLTEWWQCYDSWHLVGKFGVVEYAGDIVALKQSCRELERGCLRVGVCVVFSLQIFTGVQSQGDVSVRSPTRRNAWDHPELSPSFLHHLWFNGHVWPHYVAGRKARRVILSLALMYFPVN